MHGWQALVQRSTSRERRLRHVRWSVALVAVLLAALTAGIGLGRALREKPLAYAVNTGQLGAQGQIQVHDVPTVLAFSDGSELRLDSGARGRLISVAHDGARIRIADGSAELALPGHPQQRWELDVGPYTLLVNEGRVTVRWQAREQMLDVQVASGATSVEGPLADDVITLHAGQQLTIKSNSH